MRPCGLTLLSLIILLSGCTRHADDNPSVAVSIEPQRWLVEQIAGDSIRVATLLSETDDAEMFDPTVSKLRAVENSDLYLTLNLLDFERAVNERLSSSNPEFSPIVITEGLPHLRHDDFHGHSSDPHVWSSVANMRVLARNTAEALSARYPANATVYAENLSALELRLDSLDSRIRSLLANRRTDAFLVWHPSLGYFAEDYGLQQIVIGPSNGKEMSASTLRDNIRRAHQSGARVLILEPGADMRRIRAVTDAIPDLQVVTLNPLAYDWEEEMIRTAEALCH